MIAPQLLELVCSRLCHDLVGPIGAVNNGMELVGELGPEAAGDALDLVATAARSAANRLAFLRFAFGAAGSGDLLGPDAARTVLAGWFEGTKVAVHWPDPPEAPGRGLLKLALLAALLAEEGLPRGGNLTVTGIATAAGPGLELEGHGPQAGLRAETLAALDGKVAVTAATPRSVIAHILAPLAASHGLAIRPGPGAADGFRLRIVPAT